MIITPEVWRSDGVEVDFTDRYWINGKYRELVSAPSTHHLCKSILLEVGFLLGVCELCGCGSTDGLVG